MGEEKGKQMVRIRTVGPGASRAEAAVHNLCVSVLGSVIMRRGMSRFLFLSFIFLPCLALRLYPFVLLEEGCRGRTVSQLNANA